MKPYLLGICFFLTGCMATTVVSNYDSDDDGTRAVLASRVAISSNISGTTVIKYNADGQIVSISVPPIDNATATLASGTEVTSEINASSAGVTGIGSVFAAYHLFVP